MKENRTFHFTHQDYPRLKRPRHIHQMPPERRKLRNNVEATMKEFTCKMPGGKLKVRGAFKTSIFAYSMGISINFGRIFRLVTEDPEALGHIFKERLFVLLKTVNVFLMNRLKNVFPFRSCNLLRIARSF